ncbi:hypothetical protein BV25DRAFT_1826838 [Artomyces pyxidatus]|uniref:Uncharacterized protein n=1 Tax=Artomyces pyxidatus TaxID=48021 RepID=A0ACB8SZR7_9AGAM|nr:hypothetical protein BV25DRAFT_1826838 [Artomyces pyxidatus]
MSAHSKPGSSHLQDRRLSPQHHILDRQPFQSPPIDASMKVVRLVQKRGSRLYDPSKSSRCVCQHCGAAFASAWNDGIYLEHEHDGVLVSCELCPLCQKRLRAFLGHRVELMQRNGVRRGCGVMSRDRVQEASDEDGAEEMEAERENVGQDAEDGQRQDERPKTRKRAAAEDDSEGPAVDRRGHAGAARSVARGLGDRIRPGNKAHVQRCSPCDQTFESRGGLMRHLEQTRRHGGGSKFPCHYCGRTFTRKDGVLTHQKGSQFCQAIRAYREVDPRA